MARACARAAAEPWRERLALCSSPEPDAGRGLFLLHKSNQLESVSNDKHCTCTNSQRALGRTDVLHRHNQRHRRRHRLHPHPCCVKHGPPHQKTERHHSELASETPPNAFIRNGKSNRPQCSPHPPQWPTHLLGAERRRLSATLWSLRPISSALHRESYHIHRRDYAETSSGTMDRTTGPASQITHL